MFVLMPCRILSCKVKINVLMIVQMDIRRVGLIVLRLLFVILLVGIVLLKMMRTNVLLVHQLWHLITIL